MASRQDEEKPGLLEEFTDIQRFIKRAILRARPTWTLEDREDLAQSALARLMNLTRQQSGNGFSRAYLSKVVFSHIVDEFRRRRPPSINLEGGRRGAALQAWSTLDHRPLTSESPPN